MPATLAAGLLLALGALAAPPPADGVLWRLDPCSGPLRPGACATAEPPPAVPDEPLLDLGGLLGDDGQRGEIAVAAALGRLGTPFSWGGGSAGGPTFGIGHGAQTVGFDCSGFTLYAWAQAGVSLGHYTGTQFRQGVRVRKAELRPGDLVFFGKRKKDPTHVGLFLTPGVMVHAPQTGEVVKKTDFAQSPYYSRRYRGAVRPG